MTKRYYCPGCGQVAGPRSERHIAVVRGGRVKPHFRVSALTVFLGGLKEQMRDLCPGGPIDKSKDRAP